jgi:hypothetical protein
MDIYVEATRMDKVRNEYIRGNLKVVPVAKFF